MPSDLLASLEAWKSHFGSGDSRDLRRLLRQAAARRFDQAAELIRLHECLLFLRAYPADAQVMRLAGAALCAFPQRIAGLRDLTQFEDATVSGIAGTSFSAVFSFEVARQLAARYPRDIEVDWENYDAIEKLGPVLRRCVPLIAEDWPVEAHVPFRAWMDAARPSDSSALSWLLESIARLPLTPRDQSDLYDSAELLLIWRITPPVSRTCMRRPIRQPYFHHRRLLRRADISLAEEMEVPPLSIERLSAPQARQSINLILDTSAVRYRELYGFTHPDTRRVYRTDAGRGVEIIFFGVPPEWRLPLRAYHAGMFFKNGVPAGYIEVLSLAERAEVGFNLYYTFREGESAWIFARLLRLFRQVLGARCFTIDPYQIGLENDEALDSGAFWFYRKLGFRPLDPGALRLARREEQRIRQTPGYRTSRHTLCKLAHSYLIYECPDADHGAWDEFRVRNIGLRRAAVSGRETLLRELARGRSPRDRAAVEEILRAKIGPGETRYLRLLQRERWLRDALIELGKPQLSPSSDFKRA